MSCESKKKCYFCTRNEQQVLKNSEITSWVTEKEVFKKTLKKVAKRFGNGKIKMLSLHPARGKFLRNNEVKTG